MNRRAFLTGLVTAPVVAVIPPSALQGFSFLDPITLDPDPTWSEIVQQFLENLERAGVPVPIRMTASAAGIDAPRGPGHEERNAL